MCSPHWSAFGVEHMSKEEDEENWNTKVCGNESRCIEFWHASLLGREFVTEQREPLKEGDQDTEDQRDVRTDNTKWRFVSELGLVNSLSLASTYESNVGDQDGNPSEDTKHSHKVYEIPEDGVRVGIDSEVRQKSKAGRETQGIDRNTATIGSGEDLGSISF